jgi:hypothetical protein
LVFGVEFLDWELEGELLGGWDVLESLRLSLFNMSLYGLADCCFFCLRSARRQP